MNQSVIIPLEVKCIGNFIGKGGANLKKIITNMKRSIIGRNHDISKEEWENVKISIKIEKCLNSVIANIYCSEKNFSIINQLLFKYVNIHNKEYKKYLSRTESKKSQIINYKIGIDSNIFQTYNNMNRKLNELKSDVSKIPLIYSIENIEILENIKGDNCINIGDKSIFNIGIKIEIKGLPETKYITSVVKNFYNIHKINDNNVFIPIYRWESNIGKDITYGLYKKTSIVSPIPRCVSC